MIIEAALGFYSRHCVADIARRDASAIKLSRTSESISSIISTSKTNSNECGRTLKIAKARSEVQAFIQNVYHLS
jgi:hypothetical protein